MLNPVIDIRIKNEDGKVLFFDYVVEGEIVSTWKVLTNTAKFSLPRKVSQLNDELPKLIQVGNEVSIRLGYDCDFVEEFKGYITSIGSKFPVEIECEDLMWKLKQTEVNESWKKTDLQTVIKKIVPAGVSFEVDNRPMGDLRLSKVSVAQVLDKFKDIGITSFVRAGELHVGFAYKDSWSADTTKHVYYHFQKNIIENDLTYKHKKDIKVKIECSSKQANGEVLKYVYPNNNPDAELHTFHQPNGMSIADMKKIAEAEYYKFVYDGFRGSFLTFGSPFCDHGYYVHLENDFYPEHNGKYLCDKAIVRFGLRGYKRELTLGKAV
jgi:hypothetical protein